MHEVVFKLIVLCLFVHNQVTLMSHSMSTTRCSSKSRQSEVQHFEFRPLGWKFGLASCREKLFVVLRQMYRPGRSTPSYCFRSVAKIMERRL